MSGDVQPRKRKDKRKKKEEDEFIPSPTQHANNGGSDEVIHVHKEGKLGGNICSKIVFFGLLGALGLMVGLIIFEFHGTSDVATQSAADSPWSVMLEGWVDDSTGHDDHDEHLATDADDHSHEDDEHEHAEPEAEYSEDDHEAGDDIEDEVLAKQTYEDLRAAYGQGSPDESDVDLTEDVDMGNEDEPSSKIQDYGTTESEPEVTETEDEEEEEEEDIREDDPQGQWKSSSGPDLLAGELEEAHTESGTEESAEESESAGEEATGAQSQLTEDQVDGNEPHVKSAKDQEIKMESTEAQEIVHDFDFESKETLANHPEQKEDLYENVDITNDADWEMRGELDEADRELDEDFPV